MDSIQKARLESVMAEAKYKARAEKIKKKRFLQSF